MCISICSCSGRRLFLSPPKHLSLSPRLYVFDWNRIFLCSCLYSPVIALCLAEQSQCSIKLWHIHLSHSLWSDRKPRKDAHIHTVVQRKLHHSMNCIVVCATNGLIIFWCRLQKWIFTGDCVWTWTCCDPLKGVEENATWNFEMKKEIFRTEMDQHQAWNWYSAGRMESEKRWNKTEGTLIDLCTISLLYPEYGVQSDFFFGSADPKYFL